MSTSSHLGPLTSSAVKDRISTSAVHAALGPAEFVDVAVSRERVRFNALYGDTQLLLVKIPEAGMELEAGLGASTVSPSLRPQSAAEPLQFHTVVHSTPFRADASGAATAPEEDPTVLVRMLRKARHFVVPLRKRTDGDALFMDRISVGRARNKDIVLRHGSVSKFHAWFEMDPEQGLRVADADSKNQTFVNGEALRPKGPRRISPGDTIRFGSVETVLCSAGALWAAVRTLGAPPTR
jgi:hypothetical protein